MADPLRLAKIDKEVLEKGNYSKMGFYLSTVGAAIIFIQGLLFIFFRSIWSTIEYGGWIGVTVVVLGIMLVIAALVIGSAAAGLVLKPDYSAAEGSTIALISFLALFLGGGYVIGSILGIIGGIMAIMWRPKKKQA
jgi:hypothetical protein